MLALVFQVFERIELNMMEEKVVTQGFNRKTLKPFPTSSIQQSCGHELKTTP
jgi:hypothetical protein